MSTDVWSLWKFRPALLAALWNSFNQKITHDRNWIFKKIDFRPKMCKQKQKKNNSGEQNHHPITRGIFHLQRSKGNINAKPPQLNRFATHAAASSAWLSHLHPPECECDGVWASRRAMQTSSVTTAPFTPQPPVTPSQIITVWWSCCGGLSVSLRRFSLSKCTICVFFSLPHCCLESG